MKKTSKPSPSSENRFPKFAKVQPAEPGCINPVLDTEGRVIGHQYIPRTNLTHKYLIKGSIQNNISYVGTPYEASFEEISQNNTPENSGQVLHEHIVNTEKRRLANRRKEDGLCPSCGKPDQNGISKPCCKKRGRS